MPGKHKVVQCDLMDRCKRCSSYPCFLIDILREEKKESAKAIAYLLGMTAEQAKMLIELEEAH